MARTIAQTLGGFSGNDGYYQRSDMIITWAFGHLLKLAEPQDYREDWKQWSISELPMFPDSFQLKLKNDKGVKKQFKVIRSLLDKADTVINAGDAGQEGELIIRRILNFAGYEGPVKRLWIQSLQPKAIKKGFNNLRPSQEYDNLANAAQARSISDWLIGLNGTRAFTTKYSPKGSNIVLSIGRVQTPTLNIVVEREKEIQDFTPQPYYQITTTFQGVSFKHKTKKFESKGEAGRILNKILGEPFEITHFSQKKRSQSPPLPLDLATAQALSNKLFDLTAKETLGILQDLYEKKLLTYPRVDNRYLPVELMDEVEEIAGGVCRYFNIDHNRLSIKKGRAFNDDKITDHHAIIPTGETSNLEKLTDNHKNVYELASRYFIGQFFPKYIFSEAEIKGRVKNELFLYKGRSMNKIGWKAVITSEGKPHSDNIGNLSETGKGKHEPTILEKETSSPNRFTDATLLRAMENAGKYIDEENLSALIEENGIGQPSTRDSIIETLIHREYIKRKGKSLYATSRGIHLIDLIETEVMYSPKLTAQWEQALSAIKNGEYSYQVFIDNSKKLSGKIVQEVKTSNKSTPFKDQSLTDIDCPECGAPIQALKGVFQCSSNNDHYAIFRNCYGRNTSLAEFKEVLTNGITKKPRTFKKKNGKGKYKAYLQIDDSGSVPYSFDTSFMKSFTSCPEDNCNGNLLLNNKIIKCSNEGCNYFRFRKFGKNIIPEKDLKTAIQKGKVLCKGFKKKKGEGTYKVWLSPEPKGKGWNAEFP